MEENKRVTWNKRGVTKWQHQSWHVGDRNGREFRIPTGELVFASDIIKDIGEKFDHSSSLLTARFLPQELD